MKKLVNYGAVTILVLIGTFQLIWAQSASDSLENRDLFSSIAEYPKDVRTSILSVTRYPKTLVKIERIQSRSSQSFQDLISGYSREEQEQLYEASRYPDQLDLLVRNGEMDNEQAKSIVQSLPGQTQTSILETYRLHFNELRKMNVIYQASQDALRNLISDYPMGVQNDFHRVVAMPDVMSLLTDNIDATVSLGEDYTAHPEEITSDMDARSAEVKAENDKALADYKQTVESNPELQSEMAQAGNSFSSTYSGSDYTPGTTVNNYYSNYPTDGYAYYNPYPYWFSYPYWYTTAIWYPRPYYYYTGFYYGSRGRIVVCGLPSPIYRSWFYSSGYYGRYPRLHQTYATYYHNSYRNTYYGNANRYSSGRSTRSYNQWDTHRTGFQANRHSRSSYDQNSSYNHNRYTNPVNSSNGNSNNTYHGNRGRHQTENNSTPVHSRSQEYHPVVPENRSSWRPAPSNNNSSGGRMHSAPASEPRMSGSSGGGGGSSHHSGGSSSSSGGGGHMGGGHSGGGGHGRGH